MSESIFQDNERNKSESFKLNSNLNNLISELSSLLKPVQLEKQEQFKTNKYPLMFIVGNPRSGTTLILQWLSSLGLFSYPTNVLNRFAYAPYIGALIQQMLFNPQYDFHNEFNITNDLDWFDSNLGKTKGAMAVSEFQHFFRNFMPNFDPEYLTDKQLEKIDYLGIKRGLASIEQVFQKPFATKAMMLQYHLDKLYKNIPNSIYIHIIREPLYNMQSILLAREKYYSDRNIWWSVKPKEYNFLKDMDVYHQIAGQVYYTNQSIEEELSKIPITNTLSLRYEDFCENPYQIYKQIVFKYQSNGYEIKAKYSEPKSFEIKNDLKLDKSEILKFEEAYNYYQNKKS